MSKRLVFILLGVGLCGVSAVFLSQTEGLSQDGSAVPRRELVSKDLASWSLFIKFDSDSPENSKVGWLEINVENSGYIKIERKKGWFNDTIKIEKSDSKILTQKETAAIFESARTFLNTFRFFNDDSELVGDGRRVTMILSSGRRTLEVVVKDVRRITDAGEGISTLFDQLEKTNLLKRGE